MTFANMRQLLHALVWARRHRTGRLKLPEFNYVRRFIRPQDIVFDVGAHGGSWTAPLSSAVPRGRVYAFEALPYYAHVLRMTARMCRWRNVDVINKAVVERAGPVRMVWRDDAGRRLTGTTHVARAPEEAGDCVTVEGITLDEFHDQIGRPPVRFIKIDIEGLELPTLRGAVRLINAHHPLLWCELWSENTRQYGYRPRDVFDFLTQHGYRTSVFTPELDLVPTDVERYPDHPVYHDILAAPAEMDLEQPPS